MHFYYIYFGLVSIYAHNGYLYINEIYIIWFLLIFYNIHFGQVCFWHIIVSIFFLKLLVSFTDNL